MQYSQDQKPSNRQVFEVQQANTHQQDNQQFTTVDKPHAALTVWNFLITATCIGLFAYVNSYFAIHLDRIFTGSTIRDDTPTFSCDVYYCDRTLYNYMYYYSFYNQCNQKICSNVVCTTYSSQCGVDQYYIDLNRYFACQPTCPNYQRSDYPKILLLAFGLSLCAAVCFALNIIVHILMGIVLNVKAKEISGKQRFALMVSFACPSLKYYFLRQRKYWGDFDLNLKTVVTTDYVCAALLTVTMAIYIWFYVIGTWFDNKEIALFFILLGAFITHWMMCWANGRAFWKAKQRFA